MAYDDIDMNAIYAIYNSNTDKLSLHIAITVVSRYLPKA